MRASKSSIIRIGLFFASMLLALPWIAFAQTAPTIKWQRCVGGSGDDYTNSICKTADGGYLVAGKSTSHDGDVSLNRGGWDAWLLKLSASGSLLWNRTFGGTGYDWATVALETPDGSYLVAGATASNDGDVVGFHRSTNPSAALYPDDTADGWVFKCRTDGNILWQQCLGGSARDHLDCMALTRDGGCIVAGLTESGEEGWFNHGRRDAFVIKLDSNGHVNWQKSYGGSFVESAESILQTADGGYIFVGSTSSNDGDVSGSHDTPGSHSDVWVVRLDLSGKVVWQRCYGGTGDDFGHSIQRTPDGGFIIAAETSSEDGDAKGLHAAAAPFPRPDVWVVRIDSVGTLQWQRCLGGSSWDWAFFAQEDTLGNVFIAANASSIDGDIQGKHGGVDTSDLWLVKLDQTGKVIWKRCYGGTGYEGMLPAHPVAYASDGGLVLALSTTSKNGDISGYHVAPFPASDGWILKLAPELNGAVQSSGQTGYSYPFPNPATTEVQLELSHVQPIQQVRFYNALGVECYPKYRIENEVLTADLDPFPAGVYFIRTLYPPVKGSLPNEINRSFVISK